MPALVRLRSVPIALAILLALSARADPASLAGHSLASALEAVAEQGALAVVFTDDVVRSWMRVVEEPAGSSPRERLAELLRPHGLELRVGPGQTLVVARAGPPERRAGLFGTVRDPEGRALSDARVILEPRGDAGLAERIETRSRLDGSFELSSVPFGRWTLLARHPSSLELEEELDLQRTEPVELVLTLPSVLQADERIEVSAAHRLLEGDGAVGVALEREVAATVAQPGDDLLHRLKILPGTVGDEVSAAFGVRGGRPDEVSIRLDGMELVDPFHLGDFHRALSAIDDQIVATSELHSGGWTADLGDRRGAVLDLTSLEASLDSRTSLALGVLDLAATTARRFGDGRLGLLASLRYGFPDLVFDLAEEESNPRFGDGYVKGDFAPRDHLSVRGHVLGTADVSDFRVEDDDSRARLRSRWDTVSAWSRAQVVGSGGRLWSGRVGLQRLEHDRTLLDAEPESFRSVDSERRTDRIDLGTTGEWPLGDHLLRGGVDGRRTRTSFEVSIEAATDDPLAAIRVPPAPPAFRFVEVVESDLLSAWVSDRWRRDRWTVEAGLRWDARSLPDEELWSPRISADVQIGPASHLRAAWGHFFQTQRPYELAVEDFETELHPAERAEHRVLGFEHRFGRRRGTALRVEVWNRRIRDPRPRWENLFDPLGRIPELEPDRVRVAPELGRAQGVELFVGGRANRRLGWFLSATISRAEERLEGSWHAAARDQPWSGVLHLDWEAPRDWDLSVSLRGHEGWPTTALDAEVVDGPDGPEVRPVLGPLRAERLPDFWRLDLRVRRAWDLSRGELGVSFDLQNLTNRSNLRGYDVALELDAGGSPVVEREAKDWAGILPSFQVTWSF